MDPERIHAYLQAACAGLGFDIGEVWRITGRGATSKPADSGKYSRVPVLYSIANRVPLREKLQAKLAHFLFFKLIFAILLNSNLRLRAK